MFGNHLTGIYEKAFDPRNTWDQRLKKAKELGFDFMEISIDETDERLDRLYWPEDRIEELRQVCRKNAVGISSMCLSGHRRFPFGSADPAVRAKAHEIMDRAIDFAYTLGIRVIQVAGYDVYYEKSTPESVRFFREGMLWSARRAARKQVMLAMEIMDTEFMNSIVKHMGYETMINSPWYRVYPDMGNVSAWTENDADEEFARGIGSIVGVHVKETKRADGSHPGKFKCVKFGTGCVDFPRRFGQLERLGYTGPYMIEMWYQEGSSDMEEIRDAACWLEEQYKAGVSGVQIGKSSCY